MREYEFIYKRSVAGEFEFLIEHGIEFDASAATFAGSLRHFLKMKEKSAGVKLPKGRA